MATERPIDFFFPPINEFVFIILPDHLEHLEGPETTSKHHFLSHNQKKINIK